MFGTSGVRSPVGEEMTAGLALDVGRALATDGRMRPLTDRRPKALVPVGDRPPRYRT